MKISALRLFNVKRFADRGVAIEGIGDGVNVLTAANEFGKSTSFEALHALFFQPHTGVPKQVQRMQQDMQRAQEELANIEVVGQAGGGAVKVTMTARMDVRRVQIDPAMAGDDIEMLEDLIAAAMNDAVNKANQASSDKMSSVTSGLPIPPGMKIPGLF